jgi:hypothetical protein
MRKGTLAGCCIEAHEHKPEELRLLARLASAWSRTRACCNQRCVQQHAISASSIAERTLLMQEESTGPFRGAIARVRMEISSGQETLFLTPKSSSTGRKTAFGRAKRSEHTCPRSSNRTVTVATRSVKICIGITCLPRWYSVTHSTRHSNNCQLGTLAMI